MHSINTYQEIVNQIKKNGKTRETPLLTFIKEKHEDETTLIKFIYRGRNKKITLPIYHEDSYEEFLCLIQDVENWMINYNLQQHILIAQVYEQFIDCLKENTRDTWIAIFRENPAQKTFVSWKNISSSLSKKSYPKNL